MCSKQKGAKIKYNAAIPTSNYGALNTHTPLDKRGIGFEFGKSAKARPRRSLRTTKDEK